VDTGTDLSVAAVAGDVLAIHFNGFHANQSVTVGYNFEMVTSGNLVTSAAFGIGPTALGNYDQVAATVHYTVVSGDISGGNVAIRLQYNSTGTKTLYAGSNYALVFNVINLG
jgi:hypothetical protein